MLGLKYFLKRSASDSLSMFMSSPPLFSKRPLKGLHSGMSATGTQEAYGDDGADERGAGRFCTDTTPTTVETKAFRRYNKLERV